MNPLCDVIIATQSGRSEYRGRCRRMSREFWRGEVCAASLPAPPGGRAMIFGFNTDVTGKDAVYHVQTEDRGVRNPVVDSIIYVGGKIVDRRRTPYVPAEATQAQIEEMVRQQHKQL